MSAPKVRKLGAPKPVPPEEIARLIRQADKRIEKLTRQRASVARRLKDARVTKRALLRVGNQLARLVSLDGAE